MSVTSIHRKLRMNIFLRDNWHCRYCDRPVRYYTDGGHLPDDAATVDHIDPEFSGGETDGVNLVTACNRCNQRKGHKVLDAGLREEMKDYNRWHREQHRNRRLG